MINFAYSAVYHVYRDPAHPEDDVVEELTEQTMIGHPHLAASDVCLEDMKHELERLADDQISKLSTGVHVVWATGVVKFFDYETDCGREYDAVVEIHQEHWRPAHEDEIRWAAEDSGADLSEYLPPAPPLTALI